MTSTVNIDPNTGIRFGVVDGKSVPDLLDDILTFGENLSYDDYMQHVEEQLRAAESLEEIRDLVPYDPETPLEFPLCEEKIEELMELIAENYEPREDEYELVFPEDDEHYLLTYLGGAPLIFVCKSKFVTRCRGCSPCVPNGGDLDSPVEENGVIAYCFNPTKYATAEFTLEPFEDKFQLVKFASK